MHQQTMAPIKSWMIRATHRQLLTFEFAQRKERHMKKYRDLNEMVEITQKGSLGTVNNMGEILFPSNGGATREVERSEKQLQYKKFLICEFKKANDFDELTSMIKRELNSLGILDWTYTLLDLPGRLTALENIGTVDSDYVEAYVGNSLYECDFLLQHAKGNDRPIFQSDIIITMNKIPFDFELKTRYEEIMYWNKKFGYDDICIIPSTSKYGGRYLLSLTSKEIDPRKFKNALSTNMPLLKILAQVICDIGSKQFKDIFVSPLKNFEAVLRSQPLNLLATMGKYDLTIQEAAQKLNIAGSTANKHILKIRKLLKAKTNHSAYEIAKRIGYIRQ
jgi:DNA-binding CsgD family transcriptional regulator